ncbi:hypothetical protein ABL78_4215 [Leptomonas seymouri]|uniref:Uncharacterized protein n=1 Tax=Leptomonas seymouri TaxID=5684 RepID=A0A0N0P5P3_LEPSE|nr:hypothetical protein ABL78_4215 [Leptomonas seymouri]|eukprot:KPI86699.1 hypothetical protein ABL78_4215 [Leptomonas seymouri]
MRPPLPSRCRSVGLNVPAMMSHPFRRRLYSASTFRSALSACRCARRHTSVAAPPPSSAPAHPRAGSRASPTAPSASAPPSSAPRPSAERWSAELPEVPYGFPKAPASASVSNGNTVTHAFTAEQSGGLQRAWLQNLPRQVATSQVSIGHRLPSKDDFWRSPPYEALREVVLRTAYHDALKIIAEHDYTFLFSDVMCNDEAPMPHVLYEDFMKVLTFCSRQRPPEEQFALPGNVLRDLMCWAAYYCTVDPFYITSASMLFHKVEQEQHLSPALHSAWVYVCTAAGKIDEALAYAVYMDQHDIPFDSTVFSFMLHPSLTPVQLHLHHVPQTSKGVVLQRRLCQDMNQHHGTTPVAVHAMFVYHMLTLRHTRKWEVLRMAAELSHKRHQQELQRLSRRAHWSSTPLTAAVTVAGSTIPEEVISSRTMQLASSLFISEKGIRWGPRTTKAMVSFMVTEASAGATMADVIFVLMRIRCNERAEALAELPRVVFSEAEQLALMQAVHRRRRADPTCAVAAPLLRELLAAGSSDIGPAVESVNAQSADAPATRLPRRNDEGIMRALQDLQKISMSSPVSDSSSQQRVSLRRGTCTESLSPACASYDGARRDGDIPLLEDDSAASLTAPSLASDTDDLALCTAAEAARELLEAVAALDRESMQHHSKNKDKRKEVWTAAAPALSSSAAAALSSSEEQLAALHVSLEAIGTSSSLSTWSIQQAKREAEEALLGEQVRTAWIAPSYQP